MASEVLAGLKLTAVEEDSIIVQWPAGGKKELRLGDVLKSRNNPKETKTIEHYE
jgi:hypothetical protein